MEGLALPSNSSQPHWEDKLFAHGIIRNLRKPQLGKICSCQFYTSWEFTGATGPPDQALLSNYFLVYRYNISRFYKFQPDCKRHRGLVASRLVATLSDLISAPDMGQGMK